MGQVHITFGTGLVYSCIPATMYGRVANVYGENPDPSEPELRRTIAGAVGRDANSLMRASGHVDARNEQAKKIIVCACGLNYQGDIPAFIAVVDGIVLPSPAGNDRI